MTKFRGLFGRRAGPAELRSPAEAEASADEVSADAAVLRFTIGPIQTFIDQSRRTRDLWAGSFLLSWLAGQAMTMITADKGARLDHPMVDGETPDALFAAIMRARARSAGTPLPVGPVLMPSLPNELRAVVDNPDHAARLAGMAARAVRDAWQRVAAEVFDAFVQPFLDGCEPEQRQRTQRIWTRQIGTDPTDEPFWEIAWAAGARDDGDDTWLAAHKLTRPSRISAAEEGDLCTLMHDWQELSGHSRVLSGGRQAQQKFWEGFRCHIASHFGQGHDSAGRLIELAESERLSAIAMVRRLFPLLPVQRLANVIGWYPEDADRSRLDGRQPYSYRPSTSAIATVHWLNRVKRHADAESVEAFVDKVGAASRALAKAERHSPIEIVKHLGDLGDVDGKLFYESTIDNPRELQIHAARRSDLKKALDTLSKSPTPDGSTLGAPSPYYALLRMDGDGVGALVDLHGRSVSEAIGVFGRSVPKLIANHQALPIYTGGDDLMAMAPLEEALGLAESLSLAYREHLRPIAPEATISAGLVFAHCQAPLSGVTEESRRLLDGVAKGLNGRASLATSVYRIGGPTLTWATLFEREGEDSRPFRPVASLDTMLTAGDTTFQAIASNRMVYNVRDRLKAFMTRPGADWGAVIEGKAGGMQMSAEELSLLLSAVAGDARTSLSPNRLREVVELLSVGSRRLTRMRSRGDDGYDAIRSPGGASFDALLLFRFLAAQWRKTPADAPVLERAS